MEPKLFLVFEQDQTLVVRFGGFYNNLEMQESAIEALEILKAKKLNKMLLDLTKLEVLMNRSQIWVKEVWFPTAKTHGLNYLSCIIPIGFLNQKDIDDFNKNEHHKELELKFFESAEKANDWVKSVE